MECRIRSFDRDAGVGKLSSEDLVRALKFIVPADRRRTLHPKILRAMRAGVDTVKCEVVPVVDKSKQPTSLILMEIRFGSEVDGQGRPIDDGPDVDEDPIEEELER